MSHVAMVVHSRYPTGEPRVERAARAAVSAGWQVTVVCLREEGETAEEIIDGVTVRRLPVSHQRGGGAVALVREYVTFAALATRAVARLGRSVEVVHVNAPPDFLVFAALPAKLRGARVILDIHDLSPDMLSVRFEGRASRVAQRVLRAVERAAARLSDRVITVHEPYRQELARHGIDPGRVEVVMNSPDPDVLSQVVPAPRTSDGFSVAYHGTVTWWYGVDLIVEAVAQLIPTIPGISAILVGGGDGVNKVRDRARELGIADCIETTGAYVPLPAALARVATADCGVIPNRPTALNRFALSSKLMEYVALRIPVVVAGLPTLRSHFDNDEVLFFTPGDHTDLAAGIAAIHADPAAAAERAERARTRLQQYEWPANRLRYLKLLSALRRTAP